jgi:hypothetical protein
MLGSGYRHYHPDAQRKFRKLPPQRPIFGPNCALVVSVATAKVAVVRGLSAMSLYRETDAETGWLGDQDSNLD